MLTIPSRRQNSSCDQCRRSKRRCAPSANATVEPGYACNNCVQLGNICTFEFATSRLVKHRSHKLIKADGNQPVGIHGQSIQDVAPRCLSNMSCSASSTESQTSADITLANNFSTEDLLDLDMFIYNFGNEWADPIASNIAFDSIQTLPSPEETKPDSSPSRTSDSRQKSPTMAVQGNLSGLWHGSPIHLLNSSVASYLVDIRLRNVYNTMLTGIATRYLAYGCNMFAGVHTYTFDADAHSRALIDSPSSSSVSDDLSDKSTISVQHSPINASNSSISGGARTEQGRIVTLIGVARLLDNFGDLYGNRIDNGTKKQDETTLVACLYAFALQWKSVKETSETITRDTSTSIYNTAWFQAHSQIVASRENVSYLHFYNLFIFHMTTVPLEAFSIIEPDEGPHDLLKYGLPRMERLNTLVESYCKNLNQSSMYRNILESSVIIMHWFGYLRDIISSVMAERACALELAPIQPMKPVDILSRDQLEEMLNIEENICKGSEHVVNGFLQSWRQLGELFTVLKPDLPDHDLVMKAASASILKTDECFAMYGAWMNQYIAAFSSLPEKSKLSVAFVILFWNGGLLQTSEQLGHACNILKSKDIEEKARRYQRLGVNGMIKIVQLVVDIYPSGEKIFSDGAQTLPLIGYHANAGLVVMALERGIRHLITINTSTELLPPSESVAGVHLKYPALWIANLKPFLQCLSILETMASGFHIAGPALKRLMGQYGDILLDSWSAEN